ncbi:MAG: hypothetical protein LBT98_03780, partial [Puniceicoccales bacterium]|nr:hypothetical protein [Puniceicoccales bacterium]
DSSGDNADSREDNSLFPRADDVDAASYPNNSTNIQVNTFREFTRKPVYYDDVNDDGILILIRELEKIVGGSFFQSAQNQSRECCTKWISNRIQYLCDSLKHVEVTSDRAKQILCILVRLPIIVFVHLFRHEGLGHVLLERCDDGSIRLATLRLLKGRLVSKEIGLLLYEKHGSRTRLHVLLGKLASENSEINQMLGELWEYIEEPVPENVEYMDYT